MSLPRRAMLEMGLEHCCQVCDAPDEPKSARCKSCINSHKLLMKNIEKFGDLHPIKNLAMDLMALARTKNRERVIVHNKNVEEIIEEQRKGKNYSKNQNLEYIKEIVEKLPKGVPEKLGRTHRKKDIEKIELSGRLGEEIKDVETKKRREIKYKILDELDEYLND